MFSIIEAPRKPIDLVDPIFLGRKLQFIIFSKSLFKSFMRENDLMLMCFSKSMCL